MGWRLELRSDEDSEDSELGNNEAWLYLCNLLFVQPFINSTNNCSTVNTVATQCIVWWSRSNSSRRGYTGPWLLYNRFHNISACIVIYKYHLFYFYFILLFIYFWRHWVFIAACGLSLAAVRGATPHCSARASHCSGFSCCGARALGVRTSVVVARGSIVVALRL